MSEYAFVSDSLFLGAHLIHFTEDAFPSLYSPRLICYWPRSWWFSVTVEYHLNVSTMSRLGARNGRSGFKYSGFERVAHE